MTQDSSLYLQKKIKILPNIIQGQFGGILRQPCRKAVPVNYTKSHILPNIIQGQLIGIVRQRCRKAVPVT